MEQQTWYKSYRFRYALKRFIMYLLFSIPACNIPFTIFGVIFGAPAAIVTSLMLSINDGKQADPNKMTPVFTKTMWLILAVEIVLITVYIVLFALLV